MIYVMHITAITIIVCISIMAGIYLGGVARKWHAEERAGRAHRFIHLVDPFSDVTVMQDSDGH